MFLEFLLRLFDAAGHMLTLSTAYLLLNVYW